MLKGKAKAQDESAEQPGQYRDNPKVNARIDEYIKNNAKHWDYITSMPRERLERALVLSEVNKLDRQQKMRDGILRKLEQNPELKQAYEILVKNVPEEQREEVMSQIARQTQRAVSRSQTQTQQQTRGAAVSV